jgi:hypothetical protein
MSGNRTKHIVGIILTVSFFTLALLHSSYAQQRALQGFVYELESSNPIWNVTVKNLRTQEETTSDREGKFQISTQLNDYLTFTMPGYQTDTAFIYEEGVRRVYMLRDESSIILDEVVITKLTDSRLESEIRRAKNEGKSIEASQQRGGLRVSPSRLFGKKAKDARANLALLIEEQNNRKVDKIFTARLIASIVPLNDEEIALFRTRFRPSVDFVKTASPEDLRIYILDSYKKFRADE